MTLSRNHVVLIVILAVVATAVWVAIRYVNDVFKERERQEELIREGKSEELAGKPPLPKPPAQPPLDRPTTRGSEVIALVAKADKRKVVVVRGNGEFVRLPSASGEAGPVVTGTLDRETVDTLARSFMDKVPDADAGDAFSTSIALNSGQKPGASLSKPGARKLLELVGRSTNRSAAPESVQLKTAPAEGDPTEPWPFPRFTPDGFTEGKRLAADTDRARFREGLIRLLDKSARFSHKGKVWKVEDLDLIP